MAMPSSGAISFDDFRDEWGITGSISADDMYRGGTYVDEVETGFWSGTTYNFSTDYFRKDENDYNENDFRWNNARVGSFNFGAFILPASTGADGFNSDYEYVALNDFRVNSGGYDYYAVRRRLHNSVNLGVPESGTISMDDLYGAADYDQLT
jgi:hypothetical protein